MRILLEIGLAALLVAFAWEKPYRELLGRSRPVVEARPEEKAKLSHGEWMWDHTHKTPLDRPAYGEHRAISTPTAGPFYP